MATEQWEEVKERFSMFIDNRPKNNKVMPRLGKAERRPEVGNILKGPEKVPLR
jgi:hypothetical protein